MDPIFALPLWLGYVSGSGLTLPFVPDCLKWRQGCCSEAFSTHTTYNLSKWARPRNMFCIRRCERFDALLWAA
eukprot:2140971-Heterocapsa_arctica.AAC.1